MGDGKRGGGGQPNWLGRVAGAAYLGGALMSELYRLLTALPVNNCHTCKWSKFDMTNHKPPRVRMDRRFGGVCEYPTSKVALPAYAGLNVRSSSLIDPKNPYTKCRVWQKKAVR